MLLPLATVELVSHSQLAELLNCCFFGGLLAFTLLIRVLYITLTAVISFFLLFFTRCLLFLLLFPGSGT